MRRFLGVVVLAGLLGILGIGFLGVRLWTATDLGRRAFGQMKTDGWHLSVGQARWVPFGECVLTDLRLRTPQGGRLHVVQVSIQPELQSLWKGVLTTRVHLKELRMDPGSWGIREPTAQERLSTGPVALEGDFVLRAKVHQLILERLSLWGPYLRLKGEGWLNDRQQAQLHLNGALPRRLLEEARLMKPSLEEPEAPWEPFQGSLEGALAHPHVSFASNFFSFSWGSQIEQ